MNPSPSFILDVLSQIGNQNDTDKDIDSDISKLCGQMRTPETPMLKLCRVSRRMDRKSREFMSRYIFSSPLNQASSKGKRLDSIKSKDERVVRAKPGLETD